MKKRIKLVLPLLIGALALVLLPMAFTGCGSTGNNPKTVEAQRFDSFRLTYNTAREGYKTFLRQVARGGVSQSQQDKADAAWDAFRSAFEIALRSSSNNWDSAAPAELMLAKDRFLNLLFQF